MKNVKTHPGEAIIAVANSPVVAAVYDRRRIRAMNTIPWSRTGRGESPRTLPSPKENFGKEKGFFDVRNGYQP
jgi:hypothetical protein